MHQHGGERFADARLAGEWKFQYWELADLLEREPTALEWAEYEVALGRRCRRCGVALDDPGLRAVGYCSSECERDDWQADVS